MRVFIFGLIIGLMAGVILAVAQTDRLAERRAASGAPGAQANAAKNAIRWRLTSVYPASLPHLGAAAGAVAETLERVTGGRLRVTVHEPGQLVAALDAFDAVASGTVDAAFASAAYWGKRSAAFEVFGGVPFGPDMATFLAWFENAGGRAAYEKLYAAFNIHAIACGAVGPTGGAFTGDVQQAGDLSGRSLAAAGLPGRVLSALGAEVRRVAPSDLAAAFADKTISAAYFSGPADDLSLGLNRFARVYYFPGWSRQSGFVDLMINMQRWNALDAGLKAQLEIVCAQSLKSGIGDIEAMQFTALKAMIRSGLRVERWPAPVVSKVRGAWDRISLSLAKGDPTFRRLIQSLNEFAEERAIWRELSSVKPARPSAAVP
jgi:TRAP-type mannitol/chloroaromatic compound transport system substrate-binding protein